MCHQCPRSSRDLGWGAGKGSPYQMKLVRLAIEVEWWSLSYLLKHQGMHLSKACALSRVKTNNNSRNLTSGCMSSQVVITWRHVSAFSKVRNVSNVHLEQGSQVSLLGPSGDMWSESPNTAKRLWLQKGVSIDSNVAFTKAGCWLTPLPSVKHDLKGYFRTQKKEDDFPSLKFPFCSVAHTVYHEVSYW